MYTCWFFLRLSEDEEEIEEMKRKTDALFNQGSGNKWTVMVC